jgi:hypothetical protein
MSGLISDAEMASLKTDLESAFQTFVRDIVVWKEPTLVRQPAPQAAEGSYGFGGNDISAEQEYIPNSGVFSAIVRYTSTKKIGQAEVLQNTNTMIPVGEAKIKVTEACYNFIENGKTDKLSFDNRDWYFAGKAQAYPFMGTLYYMYQLKPKV